jgi:hypothetical protein
MILPGTYANGFAPRDGEPLFPELWRGCVGAWNPGLGPSGLTLRDWSPYKNHGTLTNMPANDGWKTSQGKHVLDFNGSSNFVSCGSAAFFLASGQFSGSAWVRPTTGNRTEVVFAKWNIGVSPGWQFIKISGRPSVYLVNNFGSTGFFAESTVVLANNTWHHVAFTYDGSLLNTGISIFVDGMKTSVTLGVIGNGSAGTFGDSDFRIGSRNNGGSINAPFLGLVKSVAVYNRVVSDAEIRLLASRRGIAYEMAPRNWTSQQIAAYRARYYSQVIGSGVI